MDKLSAGQKLLDKFKNVYNLEGYELILKSYMFAKKAHDSQKRCSGEEYFIHPMQVSEILCDMHMDAFCISASLLHDVVEDTKYTIDDLSKLFGDTVAKLVQGVTNLAKIKFMSKEDEQTENMRRLLLAMADDVRVLLIKLADRLNNMRTLQHLSRERQINNARETLEIYAPLASRMGLSHMKCELEDLSMKYLYPEDYNNLIVEVPRILQSRQHFVNRVIHELEDKIKEIGVEGEVNGRQKHFYSIFRKMKAQGKTVDQIYDIIAVRVIVESEKDCYAVLGGIHTMYKPVPGRFKDYISMPKKNRYRSLHTTVMTNYGIPFEIQIRTREMHEQAEFGLAAHWKYKQDNKVVTNKDIDDKIRWIRDVLDLQGEVKESHDFIDSIKIDLFNTEVYVFSPKGDVFNLPAGATLVDFAYYVHSRVGDKCVGGKVNSRIVPLDTKLQNGDIVEILTNNNSKGPSRDWLNICASPSTKAKIKQFFKKSQKEDNIKIGKDMLTLEAKRRNVSLNTPESIKVLEQVCARYTLSSIEDLYASVGYGGLTVNQIIPKLVEVNKKEEVAPPSVVSDTFNYQDLKKSHDSLRQNKSNRSASDILIKGHEGLLVKVARCCNPVPYDNIVGYVSRGRGVSVHRADCTNIMGLEKERLIEAEWGHAISNDFLATLSIYGENRSGLLAEITATLNNNNIGIEMINAKVQKDNCCIITVSVQLKSTELLEYIIKKLSNLKSIISVNRV